LETLSLIDEPAGAEPLGLWSTTLSAGWSLSTSTRLTAKPWFWRAALAWSKDRPMTDGTETSAGPLETLIRTLLPFTTVFPPGGSCPVTVSGGLLEATENTFATKPALVSVLTASACDFPTTLGTATVGGPLETVNSTV
jgi:hypothetical protein